MSKRSLQQTLITLALAASFSCRVAAQESGAPVRALHGESPTGLPSTATTFESSEIATTLVELFTSEGCSSCPPAEKWLGRLKNDADLWKKVVPVAFHVDYWDRLGWRDRFAKREFTERQQRYAAAWRADSLYTPGFAVNGSEWRGWLGGHGPQAGSEKVGRLGVTLNDDMKVTATFVPEQSSKPRSLKLEVALLGNDLESDVKRGENSGRKLRHDFVVLSLASVEMSNDGDRWTGSVQLSGPSSDDKPGALAAWTTENVKPIQATGGWLKP